MKYGIFYHIVKTESEDFLSAGIFIEDGNGKEIRRIFDVATDFAALEKFVNLLNEGNVLPEHLDRMLEDFYTEHC